MKREIKLVSVAAVLIAGCASGGGTKQSEDSGIDELLKGVGCVLALGMSPDCPRHSTGSSSSSSGLTSLDLTQYSAPMEPVGRQFTSWSTLPFDTTAWASGPSMLIAYDGQFASASVPESYSSTSIAWFRYDAMGWPLYFYDRVNNDVYIDLTTNPSRTLSGVGHPGINVGFDRSVAVNPQTLFTSVTASAVGLIGNPYVAGWDYQSFGVWNMQKVDGSGIVSAHSYGAATPASAVPLSGTATFAGKLGGLYVSPAGEGSIAASDVTVNADFSARSLSFASSNTVTTRDLAAATPAPSLNLSGTLSYAPGSDAFSGTLTSASGTMSGTSNGQFYGPKAEELGGVFVVRSPSTVETFTGAFGAKQ